MTATAVVPFVSVIVPCRSEERCLDTILACDYAHDRLGVVVPDGRSEDGTRTAGMRYLFTSDPTLTSRMASGCWILGRFLPKRSTSLDRVRELAHLRGWGRAMLMRRLKGGARLLFPGLSRQYTRRRAALPPEAAPLPARS